MKRRIITPSEFRTAHAGQRIGVTASCFDLMHAGHVLLLKEAKSMVDILVVFLQTDPTVDRPSKNKPILNMEERRILVEGCRYVDHIFEYTTEVELLQGLMDLRPDIRFLGSDYVGKPFTGSELDIPIHFHNREIHNWSTSALRQRIYEEEKRLEKERIRKIEVKLVNEFKDSYLEDYIDKFGQEEGLQKFQAYFDENGGNIILAIRGCIKSYGKRADQLEISDIYEEIFRDNDPPSF